MTLQLADLPPTFRPYKSLVGDGEHRWGERVAAQHREYLRSISTGGWVFPPAPKSGDIPVYMALASDAIEPSTRQLAELAASKASRHLGVKPELVWYRQAHPGDIKTLLYMFGPDDPDALEGIFVDRAPTWGGVDPAQPDEALINAGVSWSADENVATVAHELAHAWQQMKDGPARSTSDSLDMEREAAKYEARFMARHFPQYQVRQLAGVTR